MRYQSFARRHAVLMLGASLAACLTAVAVPTAAHSAGQPVAGCAGPHTLQAITEFSPGTQDYLTTSVDKNLDGYVCTKPLPEVLPFLNISFIDNVASS